MKAVGTHSDGYLILYFRVPTCDETPSQNGNGNPIVASLFKYIDLNAEEQLI